MPAIWGQHLEEIDQEEASIRHDERCDHESPRRGRNGWGGMLENERRAASGQ